MHRFWLAVWSKRGFFSLLLLPLSYLFLVLSLRRRQQLTRKAEKLKVPTIIVGNLSVGGSGKSPVVIALANMLKQRGFTPGVISRGYGVKQSTPLMVESNSLASVVGDEPLMIHRACNCSVAVHPDRVEAAKFLLQHTNCDVIISDDGLQHYRLARSVEIALLSQESLGNQRVLPAGPLREPMSRLKTVDFCLTSTRYKPASLPNIIHYRIEPCAWVQLNTSRETPLNMQSLPLPVVAVTGIANPMRFFNTLHNLTQVNEFHIFKDHHQFTASDFSALDCKTVVMTEKDAVKCQAFAKHNWYALRIKAILPDTFADALIEKIRNDH